MKYKIIEAIDLKTNEQRKDSDTLKRMKLIITDIIPLMGVYLFPCENKFGDICSTIMTSKVVKTEIDYNDNIVIITLNTRYVLHEIRYKGEK